MREIVSGNPNSLINAIDKPGQGEAYHDYRIARSIKLMPVGEITPGDEFGRVLFQNGPVKEVGVNGCHQEDLLAIVIDRLECFQRGEFACYENRMALQKAQESLQWLEHRTSKRVQRGVEGTNVK